MVATKSTMIALGTKAPEFNLHDLLSGENKSLENLCSEVATVVMFICNHCPFVLHIVKKISELAQDYLPKEISFIAINANDVEQYPEDAPNKMVVFARKYALNFPYLYDASQAAAKAYHAACTPDFYIFDKQLACVYRGQFDDSRPSNNLPVNGQDIRRALDNILAGKAVDPKQTPSIGCNIKWKI